MKDKKASFFLKDHYATRAEARKAIAEYIRNWEFDACLHGGPGRFRLKFERAQMEDRSPTPGIVNVGVTFRAGTPKISIGGQAVAFKYPSPPCDVAVNPEVQTMYDRYMGYQRGREPLTGMANFCLTVIEHLGIKPVEQINRVPKITNKRAAAAKYFQIDMGVLKKIGKLSSTKGGPLEARKNVGVNQNLTDEERRFLKQAVRLMIRRVAEKAKAPGKNLVTISLCDLPPCG